MRTKFRGFLGSMLIAFGALAASSASGQSTTHARVSFDEGGTLVRGVDDSDWGHATMNTIILPGDTLWVRESGTTELELAGGTFLRMADGSKAEIVAFPPAAAMRAWTGSFYVHRLSRSTGDVIVQTPSCAVAIERDTCVRIDVVGEGATTTSVRWGDATVRVDVGEPQRVLAGQRVYVDPGYLPSMPVRYDAAYEDDFDAWNRKRAEILVTGVTRVPTTIPISDSSIGYSELTNYGDWVDVDNRTYWRPTFASNYVPYRSGHWSYVSNVGHCWVDDHPFGYVTSHYGRWLYLPRYGWVWSYDPVWSPAWVATVRCGPNFVWSPVDYYNRPVVVSAAATFDIGGVAFSLAATTFVPQEYVYYETSHVAPVRASIVNDIDVTNINVWNINADSRTPLVRVPYRNKNITVYNYNPKVVVRGPERLAKNDFVARDAVSNLEKSRGDRAFKMAATTSKAPAPTIVHDSTVKQKARNVRLDADQRQTTPKVARDVSIERRSTPRAKPSRGATKELSPLEDIRHKKDDGALKKDKTQATDRSKDAKRTAPGGRTDAVHMEKKDKGVPKPEAIGAPRSTPAKPKAPAGEETKVKRSKTNMETRSKKVTTPSATVEPKKINAVTRESVESEEQRGSSARAIENGNANRSRAQNRKNAGPIIKPVPPPEVENKPEADKNAEGRREGVPPAQDERKANIDGQKSVKPAGPVRTDEGKQSNGNDPAKRESKKEKR